MNFDRLLLDFFIEKKLINEATALEIYGSCDKGFCADYAVERGIIADTEIAKALSEFYGLPYSEMGMLEPNEDLIGRVGYFLLKKHNFVPIGLDNEDALITAVASPLELTALAAIAAFHIGKVKFVIVPEEQLKDYITSLAARTTTAAALSNLKVTAADRSPAKGASDEVLNAPSVKFVDSIIREAIPYRASDIHIEPFEKIVRVRYRIDGTLTDRAEFPIESFAGICARLKILAGINIAERRLPQDGRINMIINGAEYDLRVSTLPTVYGEKFVIRILDKSTFDFSRKELGFTDDENQIVDRILAHPHGIVLMTGPTGCGKSTTLYSFLKEINHPGVNIVTIEDPVEYTLHGVNQTQVNVKANLTFASALRSILRQDPNIIMIGEIRDEETAQIGIRAAITGHLVFSTLHTNDAPGSVTRLIDMGVPPYLVADSVVGVIAQRLIKKLCPQCKRLKTTDEAENKALRLSESVQIYEPVGCPFCNGTGYKGRTAVHEIMYITPEIRAAISENVTLDTLRDLAIARGMKTLWQSCRGFVLGGITSMAELMALYAE